MQRGGARLANGTELQRFLAEIRTSLVVQARVLQIRLQRTTPRERLLLGVLVLAALVYAPVAAIGWRTNQEDRYVEAMTEQSAARLDRAAARRVAAAAANTAAIDDMRTWGFEGGNLAVVRVRIEQRLAQAAADAGLANVQIMVEEETETVGPTQWLPAEIQADLLWRPTFALLDALTGWPEGFRVMAFHYEGYQPPAANAAAPPPPLPGGPARVRIGLSFPVIVPATEPQS